MLGDKMDNKMDNKNDLYCEVCWKLKFNSKQVVDRHSLICNDCSDNIEKNSR